MANEFTISGTLTVAKGSVSESLSATLRANFTGTNVIKKTQNPGTSAVAMDVTGLANLGRYFIKNNDATNSVTMLTAASSGTDMVTVQPGDFAYGYFPAGVTAPALQSSAGTPQVEYMISEQ